MKVVILAGGYGSRISEESHLKPKPMIEIGDYPILWHIMKIYSSYGFNEFIICCGYRQYVIKEYFANYYMHCNDITFNFSEKNKTTIHGNTAEPWVVTLVDTGLNTMTGGRIKRIQPFVGNESFMLTYGDGVGDIDINNLLRFHNDNRRAVTLTAVQPGGRFGTLDIDNTHAIRNFKEKSKESGGWINAGYMVCEPEIFDFIDDDSSILERKPLESLAEQGNLTAYLHHGFWQCMDTMRDKMYLEELWDTQKAPWKAW